VVGVFDSARSRGAGRHGHRELRRAPGQMSSSEIETDRSLLTAEPVLERGGEATRAAQGRRCQRDSAASRTHWIEGCGRTVWSRDVVDVATGRFVRRTEADRPAIVTNLERVSMLRRWIVVAGPRARGRTRRALLLEHHVRRAAEEVVERKAR